VIRLYPMTAVLRLFLSWCGLLALSAVDATIFVNLPFGVDAMVVYLTARDDFGLLYPVLAVAGATAGAAFMYWLGWKAGQAGLQRFLSPRHLPQMVRRLKRDPAGWYRINKLTKPESLAKTGSFPSAWLGRTNSDTARMAISLAAAAVFVADAYYFVRRV
jgi:hypothetical protein